MRANHPPPPGRQADIAILSLDDLPETMALERASFPSPWDREDFLAYLASPPAMALAVRLSGQAPLAGYLCAWLSGGKLDIHNLAVHPGLRCRGLGRFLLESALSRAVAKGARAACLLARQGNLPAITLYQNLGFAAAGRVPGYYRGEDAIHFHLNLLSSA